MNITLDEKNMNITLDEMWVRHIERFSEHMRVRLYGALIAYLLHGTEIPEKLLPYLGIIIDMIESQPSATVVADNPIDPKEQEYLEVFMEESAPAFCRQYKIEMPELKKVINSLFAYWQEATPHGGRPLRHKDADGFWERMSRVLHSELVCLGYTRKV